MEIKYRFMDAKTLSKTNTKTGIEQIRYNKNLLNEKDSSIELCFRQGQVSGIIELSLSELEVIRKSIKKQKEQDSETVLNTH